MIPNPFPRVLLISFFLATLSLAFNPGSKRGHLNRRENPVPPSSSPFIPSPPPSTDVSSRLRPTLNPPSDQSTGFRRSFSVPNNFSPLSSSKPALDTAERSAGSPAPSPHGSDGAFGPSSYPSVSTTPSDSPRSGPGRAKLADFLSPNIRGEQPLPADVPETSTSHTLPLSTANAAEEAGAKIKETYPSDQKLAPISRKKVRFDLEPYVFPKKMDPEEMDPEEMDPEKMDAKEFSTPLPPDSPTQNPAPSAPAFSSRLAKVKDSISSRFSSVQEKMRNHLVNLKDHFAIATKPGLANHWTFAGKPLFFETEELGSGKSVEGKARSAAQKFGEATVFYDLKNYKDQVRVVYTGRSRGRSTAPPEMFKTYYPEDKALPLPKTWKWENIQDAMLESEDGATDSFFKNVPERWPTRLRTKVKQLPTRLRTKVKQLPTSLRTKQMDQHPVAGRWNRLGDRVGSAWGRMKTKSSNIGETVTGLFKNPSAAVSGARGVVRPIRR
ncbi:uncharacterized protein UBRO2_01101 [Ustilago bromivora]|uniref:Effector family protein Eff1 n=1 Tax=Ustilago bromivora TaxID=307758 RepID=A0A8H8QIE4_9BASI|nr:uncharacterized protein UBRO2_01101 [Ustilago bromivora]